MADIRPPSQVATLQQLISYLYQLSEELNRALSGQGGGADTASAAAVAQLAREINRQTEVLRALVKRTAETLTSGYEAADEGITTDLGGRIDAVDGRVDALGTRVETEKVRIGNFELRTDAGRGFEIVLAG